ncbi:glucose-6-phosphate isomerase family protein [Salibacterium aidingense]|uniref:glucose-6-phosphate isomerase family protein n=1 Tax=Salibacterium aidingense TaxID=384933 RepID=UPI003BCDC8A0
MKKFDPGLGVRIDKDQMEFRYDQDVFGPQPEKRTLSDIRGSLKDPDCKGPDIVYSIAMDVGKKKHQKQLYQRKLLFGVVTYAAGALGEEPIRSQGHIHKASSHSGWSPPEIYEIWEGKAVIYMQEYADDFPGKCYAVQAGPGDVVVVPPGWAHATISADPAAPLTFGAWCDREYGFEYGKIRAHQGLAWYPILDDNFNIVWEHNDNYIYTNLIEKSPNKYENLDIIERVPIYKQFENNPDTFQFVSKPFLKRNAWENFVP